MLSEAQRNRLLDAVPSFTRKWEEWRADQAESEAHGTRRKRSADDLDSEFLRSLALHVGERVAGGNLDEVDWLFAALDELYREDGAALEAELTVGFLESLIHAIEMDGGRGATVLDAVHMGAYVREEWEVAYAYTHGGIRRDRR